MLSPYLSEYDESTSSEGSLDPLGLYPISDQLATKLVPGFRERMRHPRYLTTIAAGMVICREFDEDIVASDDRTEPWQIYEWYAVHALYTKYRTDDEAQLIGLPGVDKAKKAYNANISLNPASYLKMATVFGFHGVYKRLAVYLGFVDTHMHICEPNGLELIEKWSQDRGIGSFDYRHPLFIEWRRAVESSLSKTPVRTAGHWTQHEWRTLAECFHPDGAQRSEKAYLKRLLLSKSNGKLGALRDIWELCNGISEDEINEKVLHRMLMEKAPRYTSLLSAIREYERF